MKKDKIVTIIIILSIIVFIIAFLIPIIYIRYNYKKNSQNKLTQIPYINIQMTSNDIITADKISYKNIKSIDMPKNIYINERDIIGKCIADNITILEGEYIIKGQIKKCEN